MPTTWLGWPGGPVALGDPEETAAALLAPIAADVRRGDRAVWISAFELRALTSRIEELLERRDRGEALPLLGVPFGVKDNIDVAGLATTAGCPGFSYEPGRSATVVRRLEAAGAICLGKTNMDQFATGLVGTRSPYGIPVNVVRQELIPGGSSSGSAVAVARGDVAFALGTDTAGSGRVPAAMNGIIGLKPAPGSLPMDGVVPAVRELDCVAVFARSVGGADSVMGALDGRRWGAASDRLRVGFPASLPGCDEATVDVFSGTIDSVGAIHETAEVDLGTFIEVGDLLYGGPWIAARDTAFGAFLDEHPDEVDPAVHRTVLQGRRFSAADVFRARDRLAEMAALCARVWRDIDVLIVPAVPRTVEVVEVLRRPFGANVELGRFTNFVNLLGLAAIAVPGAPRPDGLPFGVTLVAPPGNEAALGSVARSLTAEPAPDRAGPASGEVELAVVGAHVTGFPLNGRLRERGGRLMRRTTTAPRYRLYELPGEAMRRPALERVPSGGDRVELEVWALPTSAIGELVAELEAPLAIGSVELRDGRWVPGFVGEPIGLRAAVDITHFGGWRAYQSALGEAPARGGAADSPQQGD